MKKERIIPEKYLSKDSGSPFGGDYKYIHEISVDASFQFLRHARTQNKGTPISDAYLHLLVARLEYLKEACIEQLNLDIEFVKSLI